MKKMIKICTIALLLAASSTANAKKLVKDRIMLDAVSRAPFFEQTLDAYLHRLACDDSPSFIIRELADKLYHYNPTFNKNIYTEILLRKITGIENGNRYSSSTEQNSLDKKQKSAGTSIRVNDSNANCWNVSFAVSEYNQLIFAVWQDERNGLDNPDIYGQFFDLQLNPIGSNFCIHSSTGAVAQTNPAVAAKSDGGFVVVWEDYRNGSANIYGRCFASDAKPETDDFLVNASSDPMLMPAVAADSIGSFVVTWLADESNDFNIYARKFNNNGVALMGPFKVNDDENGFQWFPAIASSSNGESIIVWEDKRDGNSNIYGQRLRSDCSKRAGNFRIDDAQGDNQQWRPKITYGGKRFVVVWEDFRNDPNGIFAQWIDASLMAEGSNLKVDDNYPEGMKEMPSAAISSKDQTIFSWQDNRSGYSKIQSYVYDESKNPLLQLQLTCSSESEEQFSSQVWLHGNITTLFYIDKNTSDSWQNIFANQVLFNYLSVELIDFSANRIGNDVMCSWTTACESNNLGFIIERKSEKTVFHKIGFVKGNGTAVGTFNYSFLDTDLSAGEYSYRLKQIDFDGTFVYSDIVDIYVGAQPNCFSISQNYPNPFNPSTTIEYTIPEQSNVQIEIFNTMGHKIKTLVSGKQGPGTYFILWDATNDNGLPVASGLYYYSIRTKDFHQVRKMLYLK